MVHDTVFVLTIILMAVLLLVFAYVAYNASSPALEYAPIQTTAYNFRSKFFWILLVAGIAITLLTTLNLPYNAKSDASANMIQIDIEGKQWSWDVSQQHAQVGDTLILNVSAADVNHGLGVYDPDMHLIGQTQAMPGYVNSLKIKLEKPGTYQLLCMEYCGLAHHAMTSEIIVTHRANEL